MGDHGHVRSWLSEVRLDQVSISFLCDHKVPLWSFAENLRSIFLILAKICEFQSKCLTARVVVVESSSRKRRLILVFDLAAKAGVGKACTIYFCLNFKSVL